MWDCRYARDRVSSATPKQSIYSEDDNRVQFCARVYDMFAFVYHSTSSPVSILSVWEIAVTAG